MDIKQAQTILQGLITQKEGELDALKLALGVLEDTYKPDMIALETAQAEADTQRNKVSEQEVSITALEQEKGTLESKVAEHEATIESLTTEKEDLQSQLVAVTAERDTLKPAETLSEEPIITP